jgi:fused signal recognition particle receptor
MLPFFSGFQNTLRQTTQAFLSFLNPEFGFSTNPEAMVWNEQFQELLEQGLLLADTGLETTAWLVEQTRKCLQTQLTFNTADVLSALSESSLALFASYGQPAYLEALQAASSRSLASVLLLGVNGAGKTTTLSKLAYWLKSNEFNVLVAAADTYRAAADEQLALWCQRVEVPLVRKPLGSDPAAVVYEALKQACNADVPRPVLLVDTAGRLQNKTNLMAELEKMKRIIDKQSLPESLQHRWLVLDGATGQNALQQVALFNETVALTGVILTKLDGSTKGGLVLALAHLYPSLPIVGLATGEQLSDWLAFDATAFVEGLFNPQTFSL